MLAVLETLLENVAFWFTACKRARLLVLTVNVIAVFLGCFFFMMFCFVLGFFSSFFAACVPWVKPTQTSGWPGLKQKVVANTYWQCSLSFFSSFFYYQDVYCQWWMYLFLVLPSPPQRITLSVWDWGDGRTPLLFFFLSFCCFQGYEAENQNEKNETQNSH